MDNEFADLNIRMEKELKQQADELFAELGLDMSTAVNIFIRTAVREHGIPFEISLEIPNAETLQAMDDVVHNRNLHGPFHTMEELMEDLNSDSDA